MIIIASAAYVEQDFQAEVGKLPPSFLPLGNKRLYEHQVATLQRVFPGEKVYLSMPESFELPEKDKYLLQCLGVVSVVVPDNLSLSESLLYVINSIGEYDEVLRLLHGDTLITDIPTDIDVLGISQTRDYYNWEVESMEKSEEYVWCGYFSFGETREFIRFLTKFRRNFVTSVREYDNKRRMGRKVIGHWFDLGHVNTYFKSRAKITTQRAFNSLDMTDGCFYKTSVNKKKICAEIFWFKSLPVNIRRFVPHLIGADSEAPEPYYTLEYLCLLPLNELYVHGRGQSYFWFNIFNHCMRFFKECKRAGASLSFHDKDYHEKASVELITTKTLLRLEEYAHSNALNLDMPTSINGDALPSLRQIAHRCIDETMSQKSILGVLHGDLCFSNLLYDSRADRLKVIDPRGLDGFGEFSIYGDLRYDLAKLTHSVIGLYDFIISGAYELKVHDGLAFDFDIHTDATVKKIMDSFIDMQMIDSLSPRQVMPLTILLFLSMLPLHADNATRQFALLANALRLYKYYFSGRL